MSHGDLYSVCPILDGPSISLDTAACATKLCERCQNIPFDDQKYGGGTWRSLSGPDSPEYLELDDGDKMRNLDVDFQLVDSWPDLEILSADGDKYAFCNMLRLTLRRSSHINPERGWISVTLTYHWRDTWSSPSQYGDYALVGLEAVVLGKEVSDKEFQCFLTR